MAAICHAHVYALLSFLRATLFRYWIFLFFVCGIFSAVTGDTCANILTPTDKLDHGGPSSASRRGLRSSGTPKVSSIPGQSTYTEAATYTAAFNTPSLVNYARKLAEITSKDLTTTIRKTDTDVSEYRHITLPNQMDVLLISDPSNRRPAVAMNVKVGSMVDPPGSTGIAALLGGSLFIKDNQSPPGQDSESTAQCAAKYFAATSTLHTEYYFATDPECFEQNLKRFAQPFVSLHPVEFGNEVRLSATDYTYGLGFERIRRSQTLPLISDPLHPLYRFTLKPRKFDMEVDEILAKITEFYDKYYSSNLMKLVIQANRSLDELEEIAKKLFSDVPNKSVELPEDSKVLFNEDGKPHYELAYDKEDVSCEVWTTQPLVISALACRSISFMFPVEDQAPFWRYKPYEYALYILGHKRQGSLFSVLEREKLAIDLSAGLTITRAGFHLFQVTVVPSVEGMTDDGIRRIGDLLFTMIRFCKLHPVEKWLYDQNAGLAEKTFRYKLTPKPLENVVSIAENLHYYPEEEWLAGPHTLYEYRPQESTAFFEALNVDNVMLVIRDRNLEPYLTDASPMVNKFYAKKELRPFFKDAWTKSLHPLEKNDDNGAAGQVEKQLLTRQITQETGLAYPKSNTLLPENMDGTKEKKEQGKEEDAVSYKSRSPLSIVEPELYEWEPFSPITASAPGVVAPKLLDIPTGHEAHGKAVMFFKQTPSAQVNLRLRIFLGPPSSTLQNNIATSLYTAIITEGMKETLDEASEAHVSFYLSGTTPFPNTLGLQVSGYSENLNSILYRVCSAISHYRLTEDSFNSMVKKQEQMLSAKVNDKTTWDEVLGNLDHLVYFSHYKAEERVNCLASLTYPNFLAELNGSLTADAQHEKGTIFEAGAANLFRQASIEGGIDGNISEEGALSLLAALTRGLGLQKPLSSADLPRRAYVTNFENPAFDSKQPSDNHDQEGSFLASASYRSPPFSMPSGDKYLISPRRYRYHSMSSIPGNHNSASLVHVSFGDIDYQTFGMLQLIIRWLHPAHIFKLASGYSDGIVAFLPFPYVNKVGLNFVISERPIRAANLTDQILWFLQKIFMGISDSRKQHGKSDEGSHSNDERPDSQTIMLTEAEFNNYVRDSVGVLRDGLMAFPCEAPNSRWRDLRPQDSAASFLQTLKYEDFLSFVESLLNRPWIVVEVEGSRDLPTEDLSEKKEDRQDNGSTKDDVSSDTTAEETTVKASDVDWIEITDVNEFKQSAGKDEGFPKPNSTFSYVNWEEERQIKG